MAHGGSGGKGGNKPKRKGAMKDALAQFAPGLEIPGVTE